MWAGGVGTDAKVYATRGEVFVEVRLGGGWEREGAKRGEAGVSGGVEFVGGWTAKGEESGGGGGGGRYEAVARGCDGGGGYRR